MAVECVRFVVEIDVGLSTALEDRGSCYNLISTALDLLLKLMLASRLRSRTRYLATI
jgi:hypothetical protein